MNTLLEDLKAVHKKMQNSYKWNINGICNNIHESNIKQFKSLTECWPKYTGDRIYPVPGDYFGYVVDGIEDEPQRMWDREVSEYAKLRWELLEWCIEHLEKEESEVNEITRKELTLYNDFLEDDLASERDRLAILLRERAMTEWNIKYSLSRIQSLRRELGR